MKTLLANLLLVTWLAGCATKPTNEPAAVYSDLSGKSALPAADAPGPPAATSPAAPSKEKAAQPAPTSRAAVPVLAQTAPETLDPRFLQPSAESFVLGPGDTIELEILGTAGSRTSVTVGL